MGRVSLWALFTSQKNKLNLDFFFLLPWRSDTFGGKLSALPTWSSKRWVQRGDLKIPQGPVILHKVGDWIPIVMNDMSYIIPPINGRIYQGVSLGFHWGWSFHRIYLKDLKRAPFSLHLQLVFGPTYSRILVNDIATWTTLRCISYYQWGIFHCYVSLSEGTLKV